MKNIILISALSLAIAGAILSTTGHRPAPTREEISWSEFCKSYGYAVDDKSNETVNEYLDAWVGSAAEEEALLNHGIEP